MYNRYIRNDAGQYERIPVQEAPPPPSGGPTPPPGPEAGHAQPPPSGFCGEGQTGSQKPPGGRRGFLSALLDKLNLRDLDTGDLLLLLIIFLLFREGEDEELLIALGLLLIL